MTQLIKLSGVLSILTLRQSAIITCCEANACRCSHFPAHSHTHTRNLIALINLPKHSKHGNNPQRVLYVIAICHISVSFSFPMVLYRFIRFPLQVLWPSCTHWSLRLHRCRLILPNLMLNDAQTVPIHINIMGKLNNFENEYTINTSAPLVCENATISAQISSIVIRGGQLKFFFRTRKNWQSTHTMKR